MTVDPQLIRDSISHAISHALPDALRDGLKDVVREEVELQLRPIQKELGEVNEDGTGGTGLSGQVARLNTKLNTVFDYKNIGYGILIAFGLAGGLLYLGFKSWIIGVLHPTTTP